MTGIRFVVVEEEGRWTWVLRTAVEVTIGDWHGSREEARRDAMARHRAEFVAVLHDLLTPTVPNRVDDRGLARQVAARLAGGRKERTVVWVDAGDEVAVHLDSLRVALRKDAVAVSVDLETDQTPRAPVGLVFAIGEGEALATPARGPAALVDRWGAALSAQVWAALQALSVEHGVERGLSPSKLAVEAGHLVLRPRLPGRGGATPR